MGNDHKDLDKVTGVHTTGHEWDGIKELNNPLPRWWLWVWAVCILFAVGYWFVYPAWPTLSGEGLRGGTPGLAQWSPQAQLKEDQQEILERRGEYLARFNEASYEEVMQNQDLYKFAMAGGKAAFKENCAMCHGTGGEGGNGYPNLNDDDWLWGGSFDEIYTTLQYGIRSGHENARTSEMPAYGDMFEASDINKLAAYVYSFSQGGAIDNESEAGVLFAENCALCHGEDAKGGREFGAPNLTDAIWLYQGTEKAIAAQITQPQHGVMPNWGERLDNDTIRQLAIYVHELGGGE